MAIKIFGWTTKAYAAGNTALSSDGLPIKIVPIIGLGPKSSDPLSNDPGIGLNERVKIDITYGKKIGGVLQYMTILDLARDSVGNIIAPTGFPIDPGPLVDLRNQEIQILDIRPSDPVEWQIIFKIELHVDENTEDLLSRSEVLDMFLYRDVDKRQNIIQFIPFPQGQFTSRASLQMTSVRQRERSLADGRDRKFITNRRDGRIPGQLGTGDRAITKDGRVDISGAGGTLNPPAIYAQDGIQVQFFAKGTDLLIATEVTDQIGAIQAILPPGSYDVFFRGGLFGENDFLIGDNALAVGVSKSVTTFGKIASDVSQSADNQFLRAVFASISWVKHFIPEDFTTVRASFRDENADPNRIYGEFGNVPNSNFARQLFGRVFKGRSFVEYIGIGMDPVQSLDTPVAGALVTFTVVITNPGTACITDTLEVQIAWTPNDLVNDGIHDLEIFRWIRGKEAPQLLDPDGTIGAGSWTPSGAATIHEAIDSPAADGDFAESSTASDTFEVSLDDPATGDPFCDRFHFMRVRCRIDFAVTDPLLSVEIFLKQGATTIATRTVALTSSFASFDFELSDLEADAITDYDDLSLLATTPADLNLIPANFESVEISFFSFDIPDRTSLGVVTAPVTQQTFANTEIEFVNPTTVEVLVPDLDISTGLAWFPRNASDLFEALASDDTVSLAIGNVFGDEFEVRLSDPAGGDPGIHTGHFVQYRARVDGLSGLPEDQLTMELRDGATIIVSQTVELGTSFANFIKSLSVAQATAIGDYDDLRLHFKRGGAGPPIANPEMQIAFADFTHPEQPNSFFDYVYMYRLFAQSTPAVTIDSGCTAPLSLEVEPC